MGVNDRMKIVMMKGVYGRIPSRRWFGNSP